MLLTMFLVQKCLGSSFPEDVWAWRLLMHWLQLQFTPCEALPSVWIGFAWLYSQACGQPCCLCTFSYPISSFQSTLHLICFDTALIEQPPLSVMPLCDLLSLWRCQWSSSGPLPSQQCSPLLCFQRTRDTQSLYCMDGHLLKLKYKYSNIFRYWFWDFISCKLKIKTLFLSDVLYICNFFTIFNFFYMYLYISFSLYLERVMVSANWRYLKHYFIFHRDDTGLEQHYDD